MSPFITQDHREKPDFEIPGDRCFVAYKKIMETWRENPRWTTVDTLASFIWPDKWQRAMVLAFLVFMGMEVMSYEERKREENGSI